ncbi:ABC transporter ATP-binding protein [Vibrio sp. S9_S30]|uniref:ABC transporter ATP-binding protein n=1 Tax=Vibrio sp. S9_S30 TaxID=2720226 RepID=UPI0016811C76|nr:ABC transporter ATP-binding protein [Vibrio sp. S9_S30]MBD1558597.1 ABC transporter ATP-binding protein [Vibrio sp. S9_S30]
MSGETITLLDGLKKTEKAIAPNLLFRSLILQAFPKLFLTIIGLNIFGKLAFLLGLLVSENLLRESNPLYLSIVFGVMFAFSKILSLVTHYFSGLYGEKTSSAIGLFFFSNINRKLLTVNSLNLDSTQFSSGNLKVLVASDIGHVQRFFNGLLSSVVPALTTLAILGPFLWQRMGLAGLLALIASFGLIPFILGIVKVINRFQKSIQKQEDDLTTLVDEWMNG